MSASRYSFMRRNVRRLNREVGSLNASQAAAKRKATGAVTKTPKKTREGPGGGDDGLLLEDDEYPLPNLMHSGVGQYMPNGEYMH